MHILSGRLVILRCNFDVSAVLSSVETSHHFAFDFVVSLIVKLISNFYVLPKNFLETTQHIVNALM